MLTISSGLRPRPGVGHAPANSYLEGVGLVVDVLNGHITAVLCALAVGFTQLEGLRLQ